MACPVCDPEVMDGGLCTKHRALARRDPPVTLEKVTPPKQRDNYLSVASLAGGLDEPEPPRRFEEQCGHTTPDWLWTVALILFIFWLLLQMGVLGWR